MPRTKLKISVAIPLAALLIGILAIVFTEIATRPISDQRQILADGSVLFLNRVAVDSKIVLKHGSTTEKLLNYLIPSNGVHSLKLNLNRPIKLNFDSVGKSQLVAEFKLTGPNANRNALANPAFYQQFRCVIYGENGFEYVAISSPSEFRIYSDGCFGTFVARRFPRDSRWLGFRIEKRKSSQEEAPWDAIAHFEIKNPARTTIQNWVADPSVKSFKGMDFSVGEVTVKTQPAQRVFWNHLITLPAAVHSNGVTLTNWSAAYIHAEDTSGNWDTFFPDRSLDPKLVWKLETDFEPVSGYSPDSLATVAVPVSLNAPFVTNIAGVPLTFSWFRRTILSAHMPTNRTDLTIKFVSAEDETGVKIKNSRATWGQFGFGQQINTDLDTKAKYVQVTVAIVPNVHVTFYTRPRLIVPEKEVP